ncbi:hypothetical protein, partial [Boseongicola aestuarii]|uniref:hypothetical protein n=1 Tax=Boseongicola aestuarii TaxID=1470561 RepID=UPI001C3E2C40
GPLGATLFATLHYKLNAIPADDHPVMGTEAGDDARVGVGGFLVAARSGWLQSARRYRLAFTLAR